MTNSEITRYCLQKSGAYEDFPFGEVPVCYKVCGKLFLQLYPLPDNHKITVSCEPMLAELYRTQYPDTVIPGYHCPKQLRPYMNTVYLNGAADDAAVFHMIDHSYNRVAGKLTRRERQKLQQAVNAPCDR